MNILMSSRKAKFTIGKLLAILSILICANFLGGCTSHSSSEHQYSSNDSYSHDDFDDEEERDDVDDDSGAMIVPTR